MRPFLKHPNGHPRQHGQPWWGWRSWTSRWTWASPRSTASSSPCGSPLPPPGIFDPPEHMRISFKTFDHMLYVMSFVRIGWPAHVALARQSQVCPPDNGAIHSVGSDFKKSTSKTDLIAKNLLRSQIGSWELCCGDEVCECLWTLGTCNFKINCVIIIISHWTKAISRAFKLLYICDNISF